MFGCDFNILTRILAAVRAVHGPGIESSGEAADARFAGEAADAHLHAAIRQIRTTLEAEYGPGLILKPGPDADVAHLLISSPDEDKWIALAVYVSNPLFDVSYPYNPVQAIVLHPGGVIFGYVGNLEHGLAALDEHHRRDFDRILAAISAVHAPGGVRSRARRLKKPKTGEGQP
jgi:hypothetical protein